MEGFLKCAHITDSHGRQLPAEVAVQRGWLIPAQKVPRWVKAGLRPGEVPLGHNLFLDQGRQYNCYTFGGRAPVLQSSVASFGCGTGILAPTTADSVLQAPVAFSGGNLTTALDSVTYPSPFVAQLNFTIPANQLSGFLLTEFGFFAGDGTLLIRLVRVGINKTSDWSPSLAHQVRF